MSHFSCAYGRFYQLGYVTRDIDAAYAQLQRTMGATPVDMIHDIRDAEGKQVVVQNVAHLALPGAEIELIQPRLEQPSIFLDALPQSPADVGLHHLGFILTDLDAWERAMAQIAANRTPIVMSGGTPQVRFAYFDTRKETGHYSEIALRFAPSRALP